MNAPHFSVAVATALLLSGPATAQDDAPRERSVHLRSCYLPEKAAGAHIVELRATLAGATGTGLLSLDPNQAILNAFGDRIGGTKIGFRKIAVTLQRTDTEDPSGGGRVIYRLQQTDGELPAAMALVVPKGTASFRLLLGEGRKVQPIPLETVPAAARRKVTAAGLTLQVPADWQQQQPSSTMRILQFALPSTKREGDAELAVFRFPGGGAVDANVRRWIGQFDARGRQSKVTSGKAGATAYTVVDVRGTYNKPIGPPMQRKSEAVHGQRMIAVILEPADSDGLYFLKAAGDAATVSAAADAIRASFGGDAATETERK